MIDKDIEEKVFNAMKECGDLADKLKAEGKSADYILTYSKGYFQGEYDTKQKLKSELETQINNTHILQSQLDVANAEKIEWKKIAEKLAEHIDFCTNNFEITKCEDYENNCAKCRLEYTRKEVENDD